MPSYIVVKVDGLTSTIRALIAMGVDVEDIKDGMAKIAAQGARIIQAHTPVKTGALRADVRGNRARAKAVVTAGRASVPYAGPINYGWPRRGIKAAMFMQSADDRMQTLGPFILEAEINKLIRARGLG